MIFLACHAPNSAAANSALSLRERANACPEVRLSNRRHALTRIMNSAWLTAFLRRQATVWLNERAILGTLKRSIASGIESPFEVTTDPILAGEKESHQQISYNPVVQRPSSRGRPQRGDKRQCTVDRKKNTPDLGHATGITDALCGQIGFAHARQALNYRWRDKKAI